MRPHPVAALALSATFLAAATPASLAAEPAPAPSAPKASAPAARAPARFDVAHGLCKDLLALPQDLRGLVIAWTAGRYHKLDRWVLDETTARAVLTGVQQECEKAPDALFRYKVLGVLDELKAGK